MPEVTTTESPAASSRPADSVRPEAPRSGRKTLVRAIVFADRLGRRGRRLVTTPGSISARTKTLMTLKSMATSTRSARGSMATSWKCPSTMSVT